MEISGTRKLSSSIWICSHYAASSRTISAATCACGALSVSTVCVDSDIYTAISIGLRPGGQTMATLLTAPLAPVPVLSPVFQSAG